MVPKKIHYCWFGGKKYPAILKKCIKSWNKYAPDYEIIEWNENNFDVGVNSFVKEAYASQAWAFVSDYARLKIIYENGGIYLDTDVELIKNPDFLLNNEFYIGVQQAHRLCTTGLGFGAVRHNEIVREMLNEYNGLHFSPDNIDILCPFLNNRVIAGKGYEYKDEVVSLHNMTVYPPRFFDPVAPGDKQKDLLCDDTVSIHHYSANWLPKSVQFRRKLILLLGQRNANKIKRMLRL